MPMNGLGLPGPGSIRAVASAAASSGVAHAGALRTGNAFEITAWPRVSNVVHSPPMNGSGAIGGGMFCFANWSVSHASISRYPSPTTGTDGLFTASSMFWSRSPTSAASTLRVGELDSPEPLDDGVDLRPPALECEPITEHGEAERIEVALEQPRGLVVVQRSASLERTPALLDEADRVVERLQRFQALEVPMDLGALRRLANDHDRPHVTREERHRDASRVEFAGLHREARVELHRRVPLRRESRERGNRLQHRPLLIHVEEQRLDRSALRVRLGCPRIADEDTHEAPVRGRRQRLDAERAQLPAIPAGIVLRR